MPRTRCWPTRPGGSNGTRRTSTGCHHWPVSEHTGRREYTGRCECGGVAYRVRGPLRDVFNCHCGRCRRFSGHHLAVTAANPNQVTITEQSLTWYAPVPGVEYGFCARCGSSLFWRVADRPEQLSICAGTLDQPTGLTTTTAWWVAEAADYHVRPPLVEHPYDG